MSAPWLSKSIVQRNSEDQIATSLVPYQHSPLDILRHNPRDTLARNNWILKNGGLINKMALRYVDSTLHMDELFNVAVMGVIRAWETFDPQKASFARYACLWMNASLQQHARENWRYYHPFCWHKTFGEGNKTPRAALSSLDAGEEGESLLETVGVGPTQELEIVKKEERAMVRKAISSSLSELSDIRMSIIARDRILAERQKSLADIGRSFKISRERARQLENKLIKDVKSRLIENHP